MIHVILLQRLIEIPQHVSHLKASSHCASLTIKLCWNRVNLRLAFIVVFMQLSFVLVVKPCSIVWYGVSSIKVLIYRSFISVFSVIFTSQTVLLNTFCHYHFVCQTVIWKRAWLYRWSQQNLSDVLSLHFVTQGSLLVWIHKAMGTLISAGCLFTTLLSGVLLGPS